MADLHKMTDRMAAHGPRLRRQLVRLYGAACDVDHLWQRATVMLGERHDDRPSALLALDTARIGDPDWFLAPDMFGYSTYADRFGGTLEGVRGHIDHLSALGVRYLHLLAVVRAREGESDGGFAVADYLSVEPHLGTMRDLEALTSALRDAQISPCIDLALNHTADQHDWAIAAQAGDPFYRDFYIVLDDVAVREVERNLLQVFPTTAPGNFTHVPAMQGWVWTTFYPYQWDLNWANPEVFLAILDVMLRLANRGIEAFRLDSIAFLWKAAGTNCRNRPEAHFIVRALRAALDIVAPATLLKAEAIVPTKYVAPYFGADEGDGFEPECHLVYNNSLMVAGWVGLAEGLAELPVTILKASEALPDKGNWVSYARCHDEIGWGAVLGDLAQIDPEPEDRLRTAARFLDGAGTSWSRGRPFQSDGSLLHGTNGSFASLAGLEAAETDEEREEACQRIRLLNALAIASGGLALTYMGDEIGLLNDYGFLENEDRAKEGRWLHRPVMDWDAVSSRSAPRILADLQSLRDARIASGFAGAPCSFDSGDARIAALCCGEDRVYLNFSAVPIDLTAPISSWRDRLSNERGRAALNIAAWQARWLTPQP